MTEKKFKTAIIDNNERGSVGEFLTQKINPDAELSFVSAYFTYNFIHRGPMEQEIKRDEYTR